MKVLLIFVLALGLSPVPASAEIILDGDLELHQAVQASEQAERLQPPAPPPPAVPLGLHGLPFAPDGLSDCDEMNF